MKRMGWLDGITGSVDMSFSKHCPTSTMARSRVLPGCQALHACPIQISSHLITVGIIIFTLNKEACPRTRNSIHVLLSLEHQILLSVCFPVE